MPCSTSPSTFSLKYHDATLRRDASNQPVAGQTENISISVYHEVGDKFIDILPARWKRPFCKYTFKYNGSEVEAITQGMATASGVTIYVTYTFDYGEGTSNFLWGKQGSGDGEKAKNVAGEQHGYYMVNHHGGEGNLLFMSDNVSLRVSEGFNRSAHLYTNNYQWTLVGDPYGCKVLCLYDPDNSYTQYLRVKDDGINMEVKHTEDSNDLFELRTSLYANSFWLHPIYDSTLLTEETGENPVVHYVGINSMGNHPQISTAPTTATPAKTSIASYRMEELLSNHMADFVTYRGFVGGLNKTCYEANKTEIDAIFEALKDGTATDAQKARMHVFIDNPENLVQMAEGYYRIVPYVYEHDVEGLGTNRVYVRGYLNGKGDGLNTEDETAGQYNQKALRINEAKTAALADPATIFYFKGFNAENGGCKISTQGLYLDGNMLYKDEPESNNCYYEDIGGCLVQLHTADISETPRYMSYRQNFMDNEDDNDRSVHVMYCFQSNGYSRFYLQPIGSALFTAKDLSISVPPVIAFPEVPVSGMAPAGSTVTIYDDGMPVGLTTALANGTWSGTYMLATAVPCSTHEIHATVLTKDLKSLRSETATTLYNPYTIVVSTVTMINTAHPSGSLNLKDYVTVFDFLNPTNEEKVYWYWPTYPDFTFIINLTNNDPEKVRDVVLHVKTTAGTVVNIPATYAARQDRWVAYRQQRLHQFRLRTDS